MTDPQQPSSPPEPTPDQQPYAQPQYGQPQYGQQDYGQPVYDQPPSGQPGYGVSAQPYGAVPDHPQGTMILIFGIIGFFVPVFGPVAWVMGSRALKEIRASGLHPANEQLVNVGRILGIVVTVLMVLTVVLLVLLFFVAAAASAGYS